MPHKPDWHTIGPSFADSDNGLVIPVRATTAFGASLKIENLDRNDPPAYFPGGVPRGITFNRNVYQLTAEPCMPAISVECSVAGFDPSACPIYWRLQCRHVLCRYRNTSQFRYESACETFQREWRGQSRSAAFVIFGGPSTNCFCTYSDESRVLGGHALLEVAAQAGNTRLLDYVHLRIGGTNPSTDDVCGYLQAELNGGDPNFLNMLQALFRHESSSLQFDTKPQLSAHMTFTKPYHGNDPSQPDCPVEFVWPADPAQFPLASFDFGVGISQFTEVGDQKVTPEIAWDWRENVRQAVNLFFPKLRREFTPGITWLEWAMRGWAAYNGSGPQAEQYARMVSQTPEGAKVSTDTVQVLPAILPLQPTATLPPPGEWMA